MKLLILHNGWHPHQVGLFFIWHSHQVGLFFSWHSHQVGLFFFKLKSYYLQHQEKILLHFVYIVFVNYMFYVSVMSVEIYVFGLCDNIDRSVNVISVSTTQLKYLHTYSKHYLSF